MTEPTTHAPLDRRTRVVVSLLLAGWAALGLATVLVVEPWWAFYASAGFELPWLTRHVLAAGDALRAGWGLLPLGLVLAVLSLPAHVVPGSRTLRPYLGLSVGQVALLGVMLWVVLELPLINVHRALVDDEEPPLDALERRRRLIGAVSLVALPLTYGVTFLQAAAWVQLCAEALRLPRAPVGTEALRACMVAVVPALLLAASVHRAVSELRVSGPEVLLVSPAAAAAGTVALITYGVALGLRVRRPIGPT